jgi:hypothetical protein
MMALGWMLGFAALTLTAHFVELTVARRIDLDASPELRQIFGFEWPSLIYAVEIVAWQICFPLSVLCAAFTPSHARAGSGWCALVSSQLRRFV